MDKVEQDDVIALAIVLFNSDGVKGTFEMLDYNQSHGYCLRAREILNAGYRLPSLTPSSWPKPQPHENWCDRDNHHRCDCGAEDANLMLRACEEALSSNSDKSITRILMELQGHCTCHIGTETPGKNPCNIHDSKDVPTPIGLKEAVEWWLGEKDSDISPCESLARVLNNMGFKKDVSGSELIPLDEEIVARYFYEGYERDCKAIDTLSRVKFDRWEDLPKDDKMRMAFINASRNFCKVFGLPELKHSPSCGVTLLDHACDCKELKPEVSEAEWIKFLETQFKMVEGITVCEGDKRYEHYVDFKDLSKAICHRLKENK